MENEVTMDWLQILYSFIGSFFGFGFALLTEGVIHYLKNKREMRRMIDNIKDELKSIENDIKSNLNTAAILYFDTPIWDSAISMGIILKLLKSNKKIYDEVLIIYGKISTLSKMEKDFRKNEGLIYQTRAIIVKKIEELTNG